VRSTRRPDRRFPRSAAERLGGRIPVAGLPLGDGIVALRLFDASDAPAVAEACRDPEIPRWTYMAEGLTVPQAREWIERAHDTQRTGRTIRLAIVGAERGRFYGQIGVGKLNWEQSIGEIFYWLASDARGRGIAARAVRLVVPWTFATMGLARVEITVDPANAASQRVAEAAGFTREGVLRSYQRFKDTRMDAVMYSRLPGDA
jgi:RimJ/RimL family protein N-acetyltransferase